LKKYLVDKSYYSLEFFNDQILTWDKAWWYLHKNTFLECWF
jgi:hypothetical protein